MDIGAIKQGDDFLLATSTSARQGLTQRFAVASRADAMLREWPELRIHESRHVRRRH
jgi:hypothetical protein